MTKAKIEFQSISLEGPEGISIMIVTGKGRYVERLPISIAQACEAIRRLSRGVENVFAREVSLRVSQERQRGYAAGSIEAMEVAAARAAEKE